MGVRGRGVVSLTEGSLAIIITNKHTNKQSVDIFQNGSTLLLHHLLLFLLLLLLLLLLFLLRCFSIIIRGWKKVVSSWWMRALPFKNRSPSGSNNRKYEIKSRCRFEVRKSDFIIGAIDWLTRRKKRIGLMFYRYRNKHINYWCAPSCEKPTNGISVRCYYIYSHNSDVFDPI